MSESVALSISTAVGSSCLHVCLHTRHVSSYSVPSLLRTRCEHFTSCPKRRCRDQGSLLPPLSRPARPNSSSVVECVLDVASGKRALSLSLSLSTSATTCKHTRFNLHREKMLSAGAGSETPSWFYTRGRYVVFSLAHTSGVERQAGSHTRVCVPCMCAVGRCGRSLYAARYTTHHGTH